jgi:hypothetical protein
MGTTPICPNGKLPTRPLAPWSHRQQQSFPLRNPENSGNQNRFPTPIMNRQPLLVRPQVLVLTTFAVIDQEIRPAEIQRLKVVQVENDPNPVRVDCL